MEKPEDQYRTIRMERKMNAYRIRDLRTVVRIEEGYARRWIRRNWWRCLACAGWTAAGIGIRAAVAAGRPESWPVGGEIVPMAVCFTLAVLVAQGEDGAKARKRGAGR